MRFVKNLCCLALVPIVLVVMSEDSNATWTFVFFGGSAYNFETPLTICQSGHNNIGLNARYETKPFELPIYYGLRIARWKESCAWELELIHHKLHLKNRPPEVQNFSITHGYNLLTVNWARKHKGFISHLGAGVVITHPETTVRKKRYSEKVGLLNRGYYISGPTMQVAVEKRLYSWKRLFATIEGKLTGSYARIPIHDGSADVPNVVIHGLFGLGGDF